MIFHKKYYGYYKRNKKDIIYVILTLIIGAIICLMLNQFIDMQSNKGIYAGIICLVSSIYYLFLDRQLQNEKKKCIRCSLHSEKCVQRFRLCVFCASIFSVLCLVLGIIENLNSILYLYAMMIIYMFLMVMGLMNYSLIILFADERYYSSGFKVYYNEIDKIIEEEQVRTSNGILYICRLEKNEKTVGYEKMLEEDYKIFKNIIQV